MSFRRFGWWLAAISGLVYACWIPPFQSPDENNHFFRAWQLSEGHFFAEKTPDQRLGGTLPLSLSALADSFLYLRKNPDARLSWLQWQAAAAIPLRPEARAMTDFANTAMYAPAGYVPQAMAIWVARQLEAPPLLALYAARILNSMVWLLLIMASVRMFPQAAFLWLVLALMPASLVLAASCNPDVLVNGLCFWLIAAFFSGRAGAKHWLALALAAVQKTVTLSLLLAGGFLPEQKRVYVWQSALVIVLVVGWAIYAQDTFIPYDSYHPDFRDQQTLNPGVQPAAQMAYVLAHPLAFLKTAASSWLKALPSTAAHVAGKFGWEKNYLPGVWIGLLWGLLLVAATACPVRLSGRQRMLIVGISGAYWGMFAITMYALWCPVGSPVLDNWQGRYFIPVLPLLLLLPAGIAPSAKWQKWLERAAPWLLLAAQAAMCWSISQRYYF
jgi:uncharacterized membrane protein